MTAPVQPGPTPFTTAYGVGRDQAGKPLVLIRYHTLTGTVDLFCTPDEADAQAQLLTQAARQARTGLIVPGTDAATAARDWEAATNGAIAAAGG